MSMVASTLLVRPSITLTLLPFSLVTNMRFVGSARAVSYPMTRLSAINKRDFIAGLLLFLTLDRPQTIEIQGIINHTFDRRFANELAILYYQEDLAQLAGGSEFHRNTLLPIKSELGFEIIKQFRRLRVLDPGYTVSEHLESGPSGPSPIIHRPTLSLAIAPVKLFGRVLFKLRMPGLGRNMGLRVELAPLCHRP